TPALCPLPCHSAPPCPSHSFFNDTPPTGIYTLSLHDALPISYLVECLKATNGRLRGIAVVDPTVPAEALRELDRAGVAGIRLNRSEEHTSELQSRENLVCRLLLEKKKKKMRSKMVQTVTHVLI